MITINPEKLLRNVNTKGDTFFRGGLALQAEIGLQNAARYAKFLITPEGRQFTRTQTILQSFNPYTDTREYNPFAAAAARGKSQEFSQSKPKRHLGEDEGNILTNLFTAGGNIAAGLLTPDEQPGSTSQREQKDKIAISHFSNKLDPKSTATIQVRYGGELGVINRYPASNTSELSDKPIEDLIKFRIRDAVNGKWIIFPALLGSISDNSSAEVSSISYIGRADKVYVYGGYTRKIGFSIDVVALHQNDVGIIWEKINYVKGLVLPQYKSFFNEGETTKSTDDTRPVAPLVYLTLGDLFNNSPGYFESVNMTIPESSTWELSDGQQVPHVCQLTFDFTYIGKENPTMTSNQFDNIQEIYPTRVEEKAAASAEREKKIREEIKTLPFDQAFKKARAEFGKDATFEWSDGKTYNTKYKGE